MATGGVGIGEEWIAKRRRERPLPGTFETHVMLAEFGGRRLEGSTVDDLGRGLDVPPNFWPGMGLRRLSREVVSTAAQGGAVPCRPAGRVCRQWLHRSGGAWRSGFLACHVPSPICLPEEAHL